METALVFYEYLLGFGTGLFVFLTVYVYKQDKEKKVPKVARKVFIPHYNDTRCRCVNDTPSLKGELKKALPHVTDEEIDNLIKVAKWIGENG